MAGIQGEVAGMIVQGAGTARNVVAGAAGGALGVLAAGVQEAGPLGTLKKGWLSVQPEEVVLYKAKQKMTVGVKILDEVLLRIPRASIAAVAFTTSDRFAATASHLTPVGNPAPPRPRRPASATVWITAPGSTARAPSIARPPPRAR